MARPFACFVLVLFFLGEGHHILFQNRISKAIFSCVAGINEDVLEVSSWITTWYIFSLSPFNKKRKPSLGQIQLNAYLLPRLTFPLVYTVYRLCLRRVFLSLGSSPVCVCVCAHTHMCEHTGTHSTLQCLLSPASQVW